MPDPRLHYIAHNRHDGREFAWCGEAPGEERRIFCRREIGEEDVRAFTFDITAETERAAERRAAKQDRHAGGKVTDQACRESRQLHAWGMLGPPDRTGRQVRFDTPPPLFATAKDNEPGELRNFLRIGDSWRKQHNIDPMFPPHEPASDLERRPLRSATRETRNQKRDMSQESFPRRTCAGSVGDT